MLATELREWRAGGVINCSRKMLRSVRGRQKRDQLDQAAAASAMGNDGVLRAIVFNSIGRVRMISPTAP